MTALCHKAIRKQRKIEISSLRKIKIGGINVFGSEEDGVLSTKSVGTRNNRDGGIYILY